MALTVNSVHRLFPGHTVSPMVDDIVDASPDADEIAVIVNYTVAGAAGGVIAAGSLGLASVTGAFGSDTVTVAPASVTTSNSNGTYSVLVYGPNKQESVNYDSALDA